MVITPRRVPPLRHSGESALDRIGTKVLETHRASEDIAGPVCDDLTAYGTQFDRTVNVLSACWGSFVGRCTLKLCLPPISPCIMNCMDRVVF